MVGTYFLVLVVRDHANSLSLSMLVQGGTEEFRGSWSKLRKPKTVEDMARAACCTGLFVLLQSLVKCVHKGALVFCAAASTRGSFFWWFWSLQCPSCGLNIESKVVHLRGKNIYIYVLKKAQVYTDVCKFHHYQSLCCFWQESDLPDSPLHVGLSVIVSRCGGLSSAVLICLVTACRSVLFIVLIPELPS